MIATGVPVHLSFQRLRVSTPTIQWNHSLGEVVTALAAAGMRIQSLRELDGDVLHEWPMMVKGEDGLYRMPPGAPSLPLMYVLRAWCDAEDQR